MRRKRKSLEKRLIGIKPMKNETGRFIPYCDFHMHRGIPTDWYVCERLNCTHYKRLYLKNGERLQDTRKEE